MTTVTLAPSNRISSLILFVTVAAAPFPFGSTDPAAIAFWCIVLGLGVIVVSPRRLRRDHLPLLGLAVIVTLAFAFVLHEQLAGDLGSLRRIRCGANRQKHSAFRLYRPCQLPVMSPSSRSGTACQHARRDVQLYHLH